MGYLIPSGLGRVELLVRPPRGDGRAFFDSFPLFEGSAWCHDYAGPGESPLTLRLMRLIDAPWRRLTARGR